jgi:undecaprenyl-phosphate galactose phosphotransferase/putative colanic acid biosynthesis UDP-glucose lipid carrier transferase
MEATPGILGQMKFSYEAVKALAAAVDFSFIIVTATTVGFIYQYLIAGSDAIAKVCLAVGIIIGFLHVYGGHVRGLYRVPVLLAPYQNLGRIVILWASVTLLVTSSLLILEDKLNLPLWPILAALPGQILLLLVARTLFAKATNAMLSAGALLGRRVVTIGEAPELLGLNPSYLLQCFGLKEVCRVAIATNARRGPGEILADVDRAIAAARELGAEEFLLALRWASKDLLETIRARLRTSPLPVRLLPDRNIRTMVGQHGFSAERGFFPLRIQKAGLTGVESFAKRIADIAGASAAFVILWPIFLAAAAAIKLDSAGPVIFRQKRVGLNGKEFVIFKFRTMTVLEDGPAIQQACRGDRRVTRSGTFLRRSSIDELPQLFNVLKGDMSLVGPRPHAVAHDHHYKALIPDYRFRHYVKPGVTGWAQVNGLRGETASVQQMAERVEFDRWYINNWSIGLDINIMFRTCIEVLRDRAY